MSYLNRNGPEGTYDAMRASNPHPPAPVADQARTVAHLASTVHGELAHIGRHIDAAQNADSPDSLAFNLDHAARHQASGAAHAQHLKSALGDYDPAVGAELAELGQANDDHEAMMQP